MRLAVWCAVPSSGFAKIRSAKLNQHPQLPSKVQHAENAARLCYIQTYTIMFAIDFTQANTIKAVLLHVHHHQGSQSVYFQPLASTAAGLT